MTAAARCRCAARQPRAPALPPARRARSRAARERAGAARARHPRALHTVRRGASARRARRAGIETSSAWARTPSHSHIWPSPGPLAPSCARPKPRPHQARRRPRARVHTTTSFAASWRSENTTEDGALHEHFTARQRQPGEAPRRSDPEPRGATLAEPGRNRTRTTARTGACCRTPPPHQLHRDGCVRSRPASTMRSRSCESGCYSPRIFRMRS